VHVAEGLEVLAFARRAYRVPVFNELYYVGYGNPDLKSEDAWLTDIGADYNRTIVNGWRIKAKIDGFLNFLTDKITSAPGKEDPNIWMPYNIGKVRSTGFDAVAGFAHEGEWTYSFDAKYTYQSAVDRTPDSDAYGQQIPYIARHMVVISGNAVWKGWSLNPVWQMKAGRSDGYGSLPDWNTLDVTLSKSIHIRKYGNLSLRLSARNILDCRYETVSGYPMPGRNFMCGIDYRF
jgi:outer membrane receptor protein involved in Fe transport